MFNSLISKEEIQIRLIKIRGILLDWDGVFNNGFKHTQGSGFSETDSMGLNLFRYFLFRKNQSVPFCAILSGEKNDTAFYYAQREHLHACYFKIKDKSIALNDFKKRWNLHDDEIIYFFDDVLDLPIARTVGLRAYIHHPSRSHFLDFLKNENLCDIYSDLGGGNSALRELFENLMVFGDDFTSILLSREKYDEFYGNYITNRNAVNAEYYFLQNTEIISYIHT